MTIVSPVTFNNVPKVHRASSISVLNSILDLEGTCAKQTRRCGQIELVVVRSDEPVLANRLEGLDDIGNLVRAETGSS